MKHLHLLIMIIAFASCGTKKVATHEVTTGNVWGKAEMYRMDSIADMLHVDIRVDYLGAPDSTGEQKVMGSKQVTIQGEQTTEVTSATHAEAEGTTEEDSKSSDVVTKQHGYITAWSIDAIIPLLVLLLIIIYIRKK